MQLTPASDPVDPDPFDPSEIVASVMSLLLLALAIVWFIKGP